MEYESSLLCAHNAATGTYPQPVEASQRSRIMYLFNINLHVLSSTPPILYLQVFLAKMYGLHIVFYMTTLTTLGEVYKLCKFLNLPGTSSR
jgi:hypothetical protein